LERLTFEPQAGLLQPKLRKQEARWRARTMDEMFGRVEKGEMSVEEMVTVVPTLQFMPEVPERKRRGERPPVEAESQEGRSTGGEGEAKA
jgi:hypothetical protein